MSIMIGLPQDLGYLTPEMKEKATLELGETEEVVRKSLLELRKLIKERGQFKGKCSDEHLLMYLRARKFNIDRTFELFSNYFHIKRTQTEVYGRHDYSGFKQSVARKMISILPYRDHEGCVILILDFGNWDMHTRKFAWLVHDLTIAVLYCVHDPGSQVCGIKIIADTGAVTFTHLKYVQPKYIQLIAKGMKSCLPARFRALHIINEPPAFQLFWNILRLVLTEKLRNRVHFHSSNMDSLLHHFSPEVIPVEYSGTLNYDPEPLLVKLTALDHEYDERMSLDYVTKHST